MSKKYKPLTLVEIEDIIRVRFFRACHRQHKEMENLPALRFATAIVESSGPIQDINSYRKLSRKILREHRDEWERRTG